MGVSDYSTVKMGTRLLEDAVLNLGSIQQTKVIYNNKATILQALADKNFELLREISRYFYATSGIYRRVCDYAAFMYRYDWYLEPAVFDSTVPQKTVLSDFSKILDYADNSHIKKVCGDIAKRIIVDGAYYGYAVEGDNRIVIQELPINYCRSRYNVGDLPAIEFNMKFFDDKFSNIAYRQKILEMFPPEFKKGYILYKKGQLPSDDLSRKYGSWYLLEPGNAIKFSFGPDDIPIFVNATPQILDLDAAQDLDRRKQMQKLLKILIQKLPLDKNGDLIFDIDEARDIHNNAIEMLQRAIGVDVLTTFADISVEDMSDTNTTTTTDDLQKVERTVFNSLGISQNMFNTDGNLSLEKSILNDESTLRQMILQFEIFFDRMIQRKNPHKKRYNFKLRMLETTQYNYKEMAKMYKEHVQLGFSKMLPQIALGHAQSSIINTAYFENEVLSLSEIMVPPMSSNTMNADGLISLSDRKNARKQQSQQGSQSSDTEAGRPEKPDDQKSEKTIQNRESMS